ncbi:histidine phosphatase family protein [Rhodococcus sp. HNM0569]|uniref:histidine phosphatase family protein n=1 Tax=Rhodococcus sp. HNM0569 TaxID=2716340 RepID=UPI00146F7A7A|nr:histidine phosphatase family protein [Rhodococcus sp. HNM0569]NLU84959.1 MSMEG_4193 family putative phosphomutase [Rhodococcus sp. HNM0569]
MTVVLVRHGRSTSNTARTLAGRSPGVELDEHGIGQAERLVDRLAAVDVVEIVQSPLLRCEQTVTPLARARGLTPVIDARLAEVDYGDWTGRELASLVKEPLWRVVQQHASAAVFPGGEGLAQVQARAVAAVREHDARLAREHGRDVLWVACTHGDVVKAVLADAIGIHLDGFQRIVAEPASLSVVRYTETSPFVLRTNDTGGDLSGLVPPRAEHPDRDASDRAEDAPRAASPSVPGGEV